MTTFTLPNAESNEADPAVVNLNAVGSTDNGLFAILSERSGTGHAAHTVTDANGTWVKRSSLDQQLGDALFRHSASLWFRQAVSADTSAAFNVTGDDGTANTKRLTVIEVAPSASFDWTFEAQSIAGTGTGSTSPLSSGSTANPGVADLFSLGFAAWRNDTAWVTPEIAFTNLDTGLTRFSPAGSGRTHGFEFTGTGEAAGAKSTSVSWAGTGHEAICGIAVFSTAAGGTVHEEAISLANAAGLTAQTVLVAENALTLSAAAVIVSDTALTAEEQVDLKAAASLLAEGGVDLDESVTLTAASKLVIVDEIKLPGRAYIPVYRPRRRH